MLINKLPTGRFILFGILLLGTISLAWAQTAEEYFTQGIRAAKNGDHKAALVLFQKARDAGMDKPSLDYDQAVSFFRSGEYAQAHTLFLRLIEDKEFSQLALFNLGLVANKKGDEKSAVSWFQKAYDNNNHPKVTALAATALKRLGAAPKIITHSQRSTWSGYTSAMIAHDSNVNLATGEVNQPSNSDTSLELYGAANKWLSGDRAHGNRLELSGVLQRYRTETQYNFADLHAGLSRFTQLNDWDVRVNGSVDEINVDNASYERIYSILWDGKKDLATDRELLLRYRFSRITTPAGYGYLAGSRHQARIGIQKHYDKKRLQAYYQLEMNNRGDYVSPVNNAFTSYSPTRHTINLTGYFPITTDWETQLDARYRISKYNDANDLPVGGAKQREDSLTTVSARLAYAMAKHRELELRYSLSNNNSNINSYDYDRALVQAGMNWSF